MAEASPKDSLGSLVARLADDIGVLIGRHFELAKVELSQEAKRYGSAVGLLAACVPFLLVGYLMICLSAGVWLGRWLGLAGGIGAVGLVNLGGAAVALVVVRIQLRKHAMLQASVAELERSAALVRPHVQ